MRESLQFSLSCRSRSLGMPLKRQEAVAEGGSKLNYIAPNRYKHLTLSETFSGIARWLIILDTILLVRLEPAEEQEVCGIQSALQKGGEGED